MKGWGTLLGHRFIATSLIIQLVVVTYLFWSYSTSSPSLTKSSKTSSSLSSSSSLVLFIGIFSSSHAFEHRQTIRETWLKFSSSKKASMEYKFIIGAAKCREENCNSDMLDQNVRLNEEMELHKDILKLDVFEDSATSKSEMLWATFYWLRNHKEFQYFLKIDHDSFLRVDLIVDELSKMQNKQSVWSGFVWKQETPIYAPGEYSYKLERLPPFVAGDTFYVSYDIIDGLSEARPNLHFPNEGHSMAVWLLPFNVSPSHDPRFTHGGACARGILTKSHLSRGNMFSIYFDTLKNQDPCASFIQPECPLCLECEPSQLHWRLKGFNCDKTGAVKLNPETSDSLEEDATKGVVGILPLLQCPKKLLEDEETPFNFVKGGKVPNERYWRFSGNINVDNSEPFVSLSAMKTDDNGPAASFITQEIEVGQEQAEPLVISGWSKADNVEHSEKGDYSVIADFTFSDGTQAYAQSVDFTDGTHDWKYNLKIFDPPKPIQQITLRCILRATMGTVWFRDISVRNLTTALCDLKHQSTFFRSLRPSTLPDLRKHLHNLQIATGELPREAKLGIASGREGLVDFHIHTDDTENGETSANHTVFESGVRFVVIWTSPANTFKLRNRRVIESIFFHHPDAHVVVYSNVLPLHFFHEFNTAGYDVQVERYNLDELAVGLPGAKWVDDLFQWATGKYFYFHLSDFLRFALLLKYGGVYTDLDSILLRPITLQNMVVAEVCGSGGCFKEGDKEFKYKYYVPTGFMAFTPNHSLAWEALSHFDTDYDPAVRHCGSMYLSMAYTKQFSSLTDVTVFSLKSFYPISEKEIVKYFTQDNPERWQFITTGEPYAFHFWGTLTHELAVPKNSLMWRALNEFSISNQRNMANLQF